MTPSLESKVVVVTGASAGVGRAVARELGKRGARVGLIARGLDGLEAAKREIEEGGGTAMIVEADVADETQVEDAAAAIGQALGPIDIWINNAMVSVFAPTHELTPTEMRRVTDVTYLGYVWGTLAALRRMKQRGRGTIVQVGSALAYRAIPLQAAYCASKHAIKGFTESLRTELLHDRAPIDLVMVDLPGVNTPQFDWSATHFSRRPRPLGKVFQPEVAARAIVHAALHPRKQVMVGGPTVLAIMAERIAPALGDLWLARKAVEGQISDEHLPRGARSNLFLPVPGDHGAHGRFDHEAHARSIQTWASQHRGALSLMFASLVTLGALLVYGKRPFGMERLIPRFA